MFENIQTLYCVSKNNTESAADHVRLDVLENKYLSLIAEHMEEVSSSSANLMTKSFEM